MTPAFVSESLMRISQREMKTQLTGYGLELRKCVCVCVSVCVSLTGSRVTAKLGEYVLFGNWKIPSDANHFLQSLLHSCAGIYKHMLTFHSVCLDRRLKRSY